MFVPSGTNQMSDFVGALSPMLTVWRKLHLEFDSMAAPPASGPEANYVSAMVNGYYLNTPSAGKSVVVLTHTSGEAGDEILSVGKLEVPGVKSYRITASKSRLGPAQTLWTHVQLDELFTSYTPNVPVRLYDDDDRYLTNDSPTHPSILDLPSPPLPALHHVEPCMATNRNKFAAAYITIVNINALGWNTTQIIPFVRHADIGLVGTPLDVGNHELKGKDRPEFWAHTVVFGYESEHDEDGDPTSEDPLLGITRKPFGGIFHTFSAVYVEAIRDHQFSQVPASVFVSVNERQNFRNRVLEEMYATIAHEIGHAPGNQLQGDDHDEKWLMTAGTAAATRLGFGPKSVKRFRAAKSWSE